MDEDVSSGDFYLIVHSNLLVCTYEIHTFCLYRYCESIFWKKGVCMVSQATVKEISTLLTSRTASPHEERGYVPHQHWDSDTQAALVILWGLLVYPLLDPDLRKNKQPCWTTLEQLTKLFPGSLGEEKQWVDILCLLKHYDYIRIRSDGVIQAGTELLSSVNAAKMYKLFRGSVLARKLFQKKDIPELQQNSTAK